MKTLTIELENQTVEVSPNDIARALKCDLGGARFLATVICNYVNGGPGNAFKELGDVMTTAHRHTQATLVRYLLGAVATYAEMYEGYWGDLNDPANSDPRNAQALKVADQVRSTIPWKYFC